MQRFLNSNTTVGWLLAAPLALVLGFFLILPIIVIVIVSFWQATEFSIIPAFSLENYKFLFGSSVTLDVFLNTFKILLRTTLRPAIF